MKKKISDVELCCALIDIKNKGCSDWTIEEVIEYIMSGLSEDEIQTVVYYEFPDKRLQREEEDVRKEMRKEFDEYGDVDFYVRNNIEENL